MAQRAKPRGRGMCLSDLTPCPGTEGPGGRSPRPNPPGLLPCEGRGKFPGRKEAGGCPPSRRLKSASLKKGRPSPSTGVASLRPYIEPGVEGAEPPPKGFGGCAPKNFKRRGELPTLPTPPRVGPNTLANPELTRVGKPGAKPPGRGSGRYAPTKPTVGKEEQ
jgi:hypothetical protein